MDISNYVSIDQWLHTLAQPLTRLNRAYLPAKDDDSHTNLSFDPIHNRLYGRWITLPHAQIIAALEIDEMAYRFFDKQLQPLHSISAVGKTSSEIDTDFSTYLATQKLDVSAFTQPLHYEIPQYFQSGQTVKAPEKRQVDLWCYVRGLANIACGEFLTFLQGESEIRIWPHHFDTGVYVQVLPSAGLGFGFAMKDNLLNEPYFYFAGYFSEDIAYRDLPELSTGRWIIEEHWKGAGIPMSALSLNLNDIHSIREFIRTVGGWYLSKTV
jgi:hypothetical protein